MGEMTYAAMLSAERDAALNELLPEWHSWQKRFVQGIGYRNRSSVMSGYMVPRDRDDDNGEHDAYLHNKTMEDIDFQVGELTEPHRTAIYCLALNLSTGAAVWCHPRLPKDRDERIVVVVAARALLMARLISAGVI